MILTHAENAKIIGGDEGIRTPDPLVANEVLSQLSHAPTAKIIIAHVPRKCRGFSLTNPRMASRTGGPTNSRSVYHRSSPWSPDE